MQPPQVRDLQDLIKTYSSSFAPQEELINNDITSNEQSGAAQVAGLEARKNTAFGQINQEAQNKGMFFSGFTPDEEAKYTANTYLPAVADLQRTIAATRSNLLGKKADLQTQARTQAIATQEQDKRDLLDFNNEQDRRKFQAEQDRIAREAAAAEAEKQRVFEGSQKAMDRAAASRAQQQNPRQEFAAVMAQAAGKDGKVSPGDYNALKKQWVAGGYGDYKTFHDTFWRFANDAHWWDYYYG